MGKRLLRPTDNKSLAAAADPGHAARRGRLPGGAFGPAPLGNVKSMGTRNDAPLRLTDFRDLAAGHLTRPVRDFVDGGSGDEPTLADLDRTAVRP